MNIKMLKAALVGLVLSVSGFANAGLITISQTQEITSDGQGFSFNFSMLPVEISNLQFFVNVNGDYSIGQNEFLELTFQDFSGLIKLSPTGVDSNTINEFSLNEFDFDTINCCINHNISASFSIGSTPSTFLQGNNFIVYLQNSSDVRDDTAWYPEHLDFVEIGFTYTTDVPEPSTLAIFALGIMGLASRRFKKQ